MTRIRPDLVVKELKKRVADVKAPVKVFNTQEFCFDKQLAFINDAARFKVAVCSRRSGKTVACAADLLHTAQTLPGDVLYITLNRRNAKRILWRDLLKINKEYAINAKVDNVDLTMTMPNGNVVHISGAKDESEIQKYRGMSFRKVYIDEVQSFRSHLQELIEDIIEPAFNRFIMVHWF